MDGSQARRPAAKAPEILELDQGYYIHASSALTDERTRVLKHGDTFAVFDRSGNIRGLGPGEHGVFHDGMRYLSQLELRINDERPLLLSSEVTSDNTLLAVDLTNSETVLDDGSLLRADQIHILRSKCLWQGVYYEQLSLQSFADHPLHFNLALLFAADFRDIFEVRGLTRRRRGELLPPNLSPGRVELSYLGLDGTRRRMLAGASPEPTETNTDGISYSLQLQPGETWEAELSFACSAGDGQPEVLTFDTARRRLREQLESRWPQITGLSSSSERFNAWHDRSLADLLMMTTELSTGPYPYAGVPWFNTVFGRDGIITAMQLLWVAPLLARGVLACLARNQATELNPLQDAEPGKILHELRGGEMAALGEIPFGRYYGSIDVTPLFVMLAGMYLERTADLDFIASIWPNIEQAIAWIDLYGDSDGDGFIDYEKKSPNGLIQQGWKDSHDSVFHADGSAARHPIALCEVQGYAYAAKHSAATIAAALGRQELGQSLAAQAEQLKLRFQQQFWSEQLGSFVLALDADKRGCHVLTSNAGHCLFAGIATPQQAERCAEALMSEVAFSGWGVRTVARGQACYNPLSYHNGSIWPHDNAILAAGFARYGLKEPALRITEAMFDSSVVAELHRLPELFCGFERRHAENLIQYPAACAPQAWAAGTVFMCIQACLGLSIDAAARRLTLNYPRLPRFLRELTLTDLKVGASSLSLCLRRAKVDISLEVLEREGDAEIVVLR